MIEMIVRINWTRDITSVDHKINIDTGVLNSVRPFAKNEKWMIKAIMPARLKIIEKIRPEKLCKETRYNPY
jgi:hypothetical protein